MLISEANRKADNEPRSLELRERLNTDVEVLKDKKLIREEVKSRLISGVQTAELEYDYLFNENKASLNKDYHLLRMLFHRMFFYRLNEKLSGFTCDHTLRFSKQILTQMQFRRGEINEILEVFKKNGGQCDCEILYNVESRLIGK